MIRRAQEAGHAVSEQPGADIVILVDLLRRSADFEGAEDVIRQHGESAAAGDDVLAVILKYEGDLIRQTDSACYTVADAMRATGD